MHWRRASRPPPSLRGAEPLKSCALCTLGSGLWVFPVHVRCNSSPRWNLPAGELLYCGNPMSANKTLRHLCFADSPPPITTSCRSSPANRPMDERIGRSCLLLAIHPVTRCVSSPIFWRIAEAQTSAYHFQPSGRSQASCWHLGGHGVPRMHIMHLNSCQPFGCSLSKLFPPSP